MSLPLNPSLGALPVYQPGRPIDEVARELGLPAASIIKLASNENPLGPSPLAVVAMERVLGALHLYPDGNAFHLKRKLAEVLHVDPGNLILGNGSNEIIEFVGHALMEPGSEVVVSQYCFAIYPIVARLFGAQVVTVPHKNFGHDLRAMRQAITARTRVVFVANPNNPTGALGDAEEIMTLIRTAPPEVLVVMDEAYVEFLEGAPNCLGLIRANALPNLLLMRTFSKIYGLAGLRLGYGIGPKNLIEALEKIRQPFNINSLIQAGALAALDDSEHIERTRKNNREGLKLLENGFRNMRLEFVPSAANFIMVRVGDGQRIFNELQKHGVIIRPMAGYQLPEWIRVSVGTPAENLRFLEVLQRVLTK